MTARSIALQALYSLDFNNELDDDLDLTVFPGMTEEEMDALDEEAKTFARLLILGTVENRSQIDQIIRKYSINRPLEKINIVDRNVLRLSLYQLLYVKDTHPTIIIDQAVKLSQSFSNDVSYKFINGLLDTYVKENIHD
ncbi:MAG TPA: transcription antitermination factor NusB [Candidatus Ornithospirochaeta avicola]|uniref:Transcription antitermination protein NusB n=1 Tax=Candidatus Ornithospirochaeta avicola TaxID=2840896 RepID=A0A9D1PRI9_9SPIO|nr:transcription antitermination factor NusB [Candidatus Ornithospirochaeta avicola]